MPITTKVNPVAAQLLAVGLCVPAMSALAQEGGQGGLEYGIRSELRYDDNIYRAERDEVDSIVLEAQPFVRGTLYNRGNTYQLEYQLTHAEYFDASDDSYDNHELTLDINHRFTDRHAIAVEAGYGDLTEQRGTGFSEEPNDLVDGPDDFTRKNLDLIYFLGVPTADLRFEFSARRNMLDFDSSYVGSSRNYTADELGALARYRLGARTDLLLEYRKLLVDYENTPLDFNGQALSLDSDEDYILAGVEWELTAKTRGQVKAGHSARDYDDDDFSSSNFHWEADVEWRPRTYSSLTLRTGRTSLETYGSGLFINSRKYEAIWSHAWSGRLRSEVALGMAEDDYENSVRNDDRFEGLLKLDYNFAPWLTFAVGYRYDENDSSFRIVEYKRNLLFLRADVEL